MVEAAPGWPWCRWPPQVGEVACGQATGPWEVARGLASSLSSDGVGTSCGVAGASWGFARELASSPSWRSLGVLVVGWDSGW